MKATTLVSPPSRILKSRAARRSGGFTLVEVMIVVFIIGVLMNLAMPAFITARDNALQRSCISTLKKIQGGKEQYALDNKIAADSSTVITWTNISPYVRFTGTIPATGPTCPTKGDAYSYGTLSTTPTCTYGGPVGLLHKIQ